MRYEYPYGFSSIHQYSPLELELRCYQDQRGPERGGLGLAGHFRKAVDLLWGPHNKTAPFVWHPWAERMNERIHAHPLTGQPYPHLALNGCGWCSKSSFGAVYAIINFLSNPFKTLILCTSTDLKAAKRRIWGTIKNYWISVPGLAGVAQILEAECSLIPLDPSGKKLSNLAGIHLIAGEKKKEKDAIGKIIGSHNERVIMIADELPELTEAIPEACFGNLITNPFFQFVAMGNFKNRYDPFGKFCEPSAGWHTVSVEDDEWETAKGWCLHFDGMRSPNILEGKDQYPIYGSKQLAAHRKDMGENTAQFWRMCRSFEAPIGIEDAIYTESDFTGGDAYGTVQWMQPPIMLSALDPSFTQGGDRCVQWIAKLGTAIDGRRILQFEKALLLRENVLIRHKDRHRQISEQFVDNCKLYEVSAFDAALDATAAGSVMHTLISEYFKSGDVLKVDFSGAPSELPVNAVDAKTSKQAYDRKVSEIWYAGKDFLKHGQIKGVTEELAREMKARRYDTVKSSDGLKIRVETKADMKQRLGFSPDMADAALVLLFLARQRHGFIPHSTITLNSGGTNLRWMDRAREYDSVYIDTFSEPASV